MKTKKMKKEFVLNLISREGGLRPLALRAYASLRSAPLGVDGGARRGGVPPLGADGVSHRGTNWAIAPTL